MTYTWTGFALAAPPAVWLALADEGGAYAETAEAIRAELQRGGGQVEVVARPWRELAGLAGAPRVVVAVGVGALRGVIETGLRPPVLATLVPRAAYASLLGALGQGGRAHTAVWLDQPAARQLDLLRLALPSRQRVGVVFGPESRFLEPELQRAAAERNLSLAAARADGVDQLPAALQATLDDADMLLILPDPQLYNGSTIQNVLTAAYRRRLPLAAFSPAYVKAGALLAVYSTPAQVGAQVGDIVRAYLAGRPLPSPQGPRDFTVGVNADVARSLGIAVDADGAAKWTEQLRARERAP